MVIVILPEIQAIDGTSAADTARFAGTYTIGAGDYTTASTGANALSQLSLLPRCGNYYHERNDSFADNETITIADAQLGGGGCKFNS